MNHELKPLLEIQGTPIYLIEDWDTGIGGGVRLSVREVCIKVCLVLTMLTSDFHQ